MHHARPRTKSASAQPALLHLNRFSQLHGFEKPNDPRALALMDLAAVEVMREFGDVRLAFGESDEYSFIFAKHTVLYQRRASKLVSLVTSCFTGNYVRYWAAHFPDTPLQRTPVFDGRAVCYPTDQALRDYLSWRQADVHINNQVRGSLIWQCAHTWFCSVAHASWQPLTPHHCRSLVWLCSTTPASGRWSSLASRRRRRKAHSRLVRLVAVGWPANTLGCNALEGKLHRYNY